MKKDFLVYGIILPVITAVVLSVAFSFFMPKYANSTQGSVGVVGAVHNDLQVSTKLSENYKKNNAIANLECGNDQMLVRYDCDYSYLSSCGSLNAQSSQFGDTGCAYVYVARGMFGNFDSLNKGDEITLTLADKECTYSLSSTFTAKSEYDVLSTAPAGKSSIIIYTQSGADIGIGTKYRALIFKGVQNGA